MAYAQSSENDARQAKVQLLPIPQLVDAATIESRGNLPSFLYLAAQPSEKYSLPWSSERDYAVGYCALRLSDSQPMRTVDKAKSWLCHNRVDRHEPILPWQAPDDVQKISPVEASRRILEHLVSSWNDAFPNDPISEQSVVLTVPASFDAAARELTREAALQAGLPENFLLLEEPQAAVYAWLANREQTWRKELTKDDTLLVCDVGGGTSDFSLIDVQENDGELSLNRLAVGNHLLVGGDNMDLAIAFLASEKFAAKGTKLDPWQNVALQHLARTAKERLLAPDAPETHTIAIAGRGRSLIGGNISVEISRNEVVDLLLNGFFPECAATDKPQKQRASGFRQMGLPYESDAAISRHLAAFLQSHLADTPDKYPTRILFNGGVFKSGCLRDRLFDTIAKWSGGKRAMAPLDAEADLDNSVAQGAAYYAWAKHNGGIRIRGGTARAYYVGIETAGLAIPGLPRPLNALCVAPIGMEEGTEIDIPNDRMEIGLAVGEQEKFRIFSSSTRRQDQPGSWLQNWTEDQLEETDSLETTLVDQQGQHADGFVPISFHSRVTELGMFELWCRSVNTDEKWKLEFSVREP